MNMFDDVSMVPRLISTSKIKFVVLEDMFKKVDIRSDMVNLYIDGYYVFYKLFKAEYTTDVYQTDFNRFVTDTVVSFLNVIAHYRRFIVTRLHKNNRIFIINNRSVPKYQSDIVKKYGKEYYEKLYPTHFEYGAINTLIDHALEMATDLCQYLEDIFVINSRKIEDHTTIAYLKNKTDGYHIYLSRNELMYLLLDDNSCLIYPKRDSSYLVTKENCFTKIFKGVKYKPENLTADYMLFYLMLTGVKSRNISGTCIKGTVKGAKILESMITDGVLDSSSSINYFIELLPNYINRELTDDEMMKLKNVAKAIDLRTSVAALTSSQKNKIDTGIVNLFDQIGLEEINQLAERESDIINLTDLNMNRVKPERSYWNWDDMDWSDYQ